MSLWKLPETPPGYKRVIYWEVPLFAVAAASTLLALGVLIGRRR